MYGRASRGASHNTTIPLAAAPTPKHSLKKKQRLGRQLSQYSACCKLENLSLSPRTQDLVFENGVYMVISHCVGRGRQIPGAHWPVESANASSGQGEALSQKVR